MGEVAVERQSITAKHHGSYSVAIHARSRGALSNFSFRAG